MIELFSVLKSNHTINKTENSFTSRRQCLEYFYLNTWHHDDVNVFHPRPRYDMDVLELEVVPYYEYLNVTNKYKYIYFLCYFIHLNHFGIYYLLMNMFIYFLAKIKDKQKTLKNIVLFVFWFCKWFVFVGLEIACSL